MNAHTRLSAKGQIVIPKAVRDARGWVPGTDLEVVDRPDGLLLRATPAPAKVPFEIALKRIRDRLDYHGPYVPEAEWKAAIDQMFIDSEAEDRRREGR